MSFGALVSTSQWEEQAESGSSVRFRDRHFDVEAVKILPGEFHTTRDDIMLVTVLGSCVSACIRDPATGVGGMNHFMLPESELLGAPTTSARYGSYAMEVLINELLKHGATRSRLEVKVFGGANVLRGFTIANIGNRNAEFVRSYLANEHIAIAAEDLGDSCPRKVHYFPRSGRVLVKRLPPTLSSPELLQEEAYSSHLRESPAGAVELFERVARP